MFAFLVGYRLTHFLPVFQKVAPKSQAVGVPLLTMLSAHSLGSGSFWLPEGRQILRKFKEQSFSPLKMWNLQDASFTLKKRILFEKFLVADCFHSPHTDSTH